MKNLLLLVSIFLSTYIITACTSVPLSTTLKMATMSERDIARINPADVRVRLTLDKPAELQEKNVRLVLDYERDNLNEMELKQSHYEFVLKLLSKENKTEEALFSADKPVTQYEFSIIDTSRREFYRHQRDFIREGKPSRYHWTVYYFLKERPQTTRALTLDVELKLHPQEGYFYLFKDARVEVNQ